MYITLKNLQSSWRRRSGCGWWRCPGRTSAVVPAAAPGEDASSAPRRWRLAGRRSVTRSGPDRSSSALRSATLYEPPATFRRRIRSNIWFRGRKHVFTWWRKQGRSQKFVSGISFYCTILQSYTLTSSAAIIAQNNFQGLIFWGMHTDIPPSLGVAVI